MTAFITARDLQHRMRDMMVCENIDEWIATDLLRMFTSAGVTGVVSVNPDRINQRGWNRSAFIAALTMRGFGVEWKCDDRPCSSPYYEISLPNE